VVTSSCDECTGENTYSKKKNQNSLIFAMDYFVFVEKSNTRVAFTIAAKIECFFADATPAVSKRLINTLAILACG